MSDFFDNLPRDEQAAMPAPADGPSPANPIAAVGRHHEATLLALPGVEGYGAGSDHLIVYLSDPQAAAQLPDALDGVPLRPVATGPIRAL
ncbi:MAG: hypothetical protein AAF899_17900 [Pseudomonadota bacterium]